MTKSFYSHLLTMSLIHGFLFFGTWQVIKSEEVQKFVPKYGNGVIQMKVSSGLFIQSASPVKKIESVKFKPVILLKEMAIWIKEAKDAGNIDTILQSAFDENLDKLSEIVGGCERIASTPIPYTYRILLHRTVYFYCLLLPFGFVDSLGWITPLITIFIAYTFVALEAIADEIEEPFGTEPNDLALNEICRTIEISLLEMAEMPIPFYSSSNSIIVN